MGVVNPTPPPAPPSGLQPCNPNVIPVTNGFGGLLQGFGPPLQPPPITNQPWLYTDESVQQNYIWSIAGQIWQ